MSDQALIPGFLLNRAAQAKAKAQAQQAKAASSPQRRTDQPAPTQSATETHQEQRSNPQPPKPEPAQRPGQNPPQSAGRKKSDHAIALRPASAPVPPDTGPVLDVDRDRLVALFRAHARNGAALGLLEEHLPAVFQAILRGATIRGPAGHQDRMTLFRMLEVPWTPTAGMRSEAGNQLDAMADRFVKAVSRIESRLGGRVPVTREAEIVLEASTEAAPAE